ncbi:hypothetical protein RFI_16320 [Reticulomyxa filosa]|uniref:Uncharacterized protein n=1 Tax=Reticulomyxa filosa TaxID=46433 RepID=X6N6I6_RETFI|nr:hypothetical protein RFI_16320 [Reticulomyxa filosa]|eukprot:ETO20892.1 hypothetical protein RFI_16320 [Reticulomyxa filosa]
MCLFFNYKLQINLFRYYQFSFDKFSQIRNEKKKVKWKTMAANENGIHEILSFLITSAEIKEEVAKKLWTELTETQDCLTMKDVLSLEQTDWEDIFKAADIKATATKKRLKSKLDDLRAQNEEDDKLITSHYFFCPNKKILSINKT